MTKEAKNFKEDCMGTYDLLIHKVCDKFSTIEAHGLKENIIRLTKIKCWT